MRARERFAPLPPLSQSAAYANQQQQQQVGRVSRHGAGEPSASSSSSPFIPGLESRPLQANPEFYKNGSLARSRNSVAPLSSSGPSSVPTSADVSLSSQHLLQHRLRRGSATSSTAHIAGGGYPGSNTPYSRHSSSMSVHQRRLMDSRGSSGSGAVPPAHSPNTAARRVGASPASLTGPAASAAALRGNRKDGHATSTALPKPVNYNELMRREQQRQQRAEGGQDTGEVAGEESAATDQNSKSLKRPPSPTTTSSPYPPSDPRSRLLAYQPQPSPTTATSASAGSGPHTSATGSLVMPSAPAGAARGTDGGFMEGPLPSEVRGIIASHFRSQLLSSATAAAAGGEAAARETKEREEEAERQARRLLSTSRRIKVYRDELRAANEEVSDLAGVVQQHHLVSSVLQAELSDIDARIAQLMQERQLCEAQLRQQGEAAIRQEGKLAEARERVAVLQSTMENITSEAQAGQTVLRQLVPGLNIENYV